VSCNVEEDFFHYFIRRNIAIITIIGIFLALSKYIVGDGTDPNAVGLSIIATIFAVFLLIVLILESLVCIIKRTREEFKKPILQFILSYLPYIAAIITVSFIIIFVYALTFSTIQEHPADVNLLILIIELLVGFFIAAVIVLYVLLQVNEFWHLAVIFFTTIILMIVLVFGFDLQHTTGASLINQPFSKGLWVMWLLPTLDIMFFIPVIKCILLFGRKRQSNNGNG
jgi:hypothetical protein